MNIRKFYTLTISLFGHRYLPNKEEVRQKLYNYLKNRISNIKVRILVGTHGDFDVIALGVCRQLKREGYDIDISLVYTSYTKLQREMKDINITYQLKDVEIMMYEIENVHYKRQIIVSNQKMVDDSDEVIVYYTGKPQWKLNNGTKCIIKYGENQDKTIINLFN